MNIDKFYVVTGILEGGMGTGDGGKIVITYREENQAVRAVELMKSLIEIAYDTIEEVEPEDRHTEYDHLVDEVTTLGLDRLLTLMFQDELELGDVRYVESSFGRLIISPH